MTVSYEIPESWKAAVSAKCLQCNEEFLQRARTDFTRLYCSKTCRYLAAQRVVLDSICAQCSTAYHRPKSGHGSYCSLSCSRAARRISSQEQLRTKVDRSGGPDACWPWTGRRSKDGYGYFSQGRSAPGSQKRAHVVAWEESSGKPVPDGLLIRHLCTGGGNPWCCNPAHLLPGTHQNNSDDKLEADRQAKGERINTARLNAESVRLIRHQVQQGWLQRVIASQFGVSQVTISRIARGSTWRHVS